MQAMRAEIQLFNRDLTGDDPEYENRNTGGFGRDGSHDAWRLLTK